MDCADPRIEAFFSGPSPWRQELAALRPILAGSGLTEDFKWRSPVYTFGGANVAILWGFRDHAALGFFKGVLLKDDAGLLVAPGKNSRSSRLMKFTAPDEVRQLEPAIRDFIRRAIDIEKAGRKVDLPGDDLAYPEELIERLDGDPALRTAFAALTPGRRRGYVPHFLQAKQPATRLSRIARCAPKILAGKGFGER